MTAPLVVRDLTVHYGGLRALDNVSLVVETGQTVGLIGPNGAGKTTLFDCVSGLVPQTSGSISIFGTDVSGRPMHQRARLAVSRTFQRLELFGSLTVLENLIVAIESREGVGGLASELLRRPASINVRRRAHHRADELVGLVGLAEHAGTRACDLSMGHARLLELARAVATEPALLMLDEPSSGLNNEESERLALLLRSLRSDRGLSMIVVEHDMDFVLPLSEIVYVLDFGKTIATGPPAKIQRDPVVRAAYLGEELPHARAAGR